MVSSICALIWLIRAFDVLLLAGAVDDGRRLLGDRHLLGAAEHVERDVFKLDAEIFGDELPAGHDRDVLEHRLAAIAEARRLDGRDLQAATQLVDDKSGKRLAFDVLGDDEERTRRLHDSLQQRQHGLQVGELLLVQEDVGVFEVGDHLLRVGDEIRGDVAAVELHAFDHFELGLERFRLLDGDDTLVADFFHRLGDHLADLRLAIRRDCADLGDFRGGLHLLGLARDVLHDLGDREIDAALKVHRVQAGSHHLGAFLDDRLGEHRGGGRAVAGDVAGLGRDLAHHLRAHVLELVLKLDFLGDRHAVLGNSGGAIALIEDDVAALRAERHPDGIGENIDATQHLVARVGGKSYVLGSHFRSPQFALMKSTAGLRGLADGLGALEHAHDIGLLHDEELLAIDLDLGAGPLAEQDAVAGLDVERLRSCRFRRGRRGRRRRLRPPAASPWRCRE